MLVSVLVVLAFIAPSQAGPSRPDQAKQDLIAIERRIGDANLNCDYDYFRKIEADEFFFTDANGGTSNKQEDLAGEKDCKKSDATYTVDDTRVMLYGENAVVTGRVTTQRTDKDGNPVVRHSRFTDVFVWRDSRWQLVAGHSSRIPAEKKN
jgi:ketosteroid isomerase-like protein